MKRAMWCFGALACVWVTVVAHAATEHRSRDPARVLASAAAQPYRALSAKQQQAFDFGHAIFNTHWVPAGTPLAERIDGLGPLFNAPSCDACHNEGARGRGPDGDGLLPMALVIELSQTLAAHTPPPTAETERGDPLYGHVFNTAAIPGYNFEGVASVRYEYRGGRYADGHPWELRIPRYTLSELSYGALAADTVVKPRLAPAVYGDGLLERVPVRWIEARADSSAGNSDGVRGRVAWRVFDDQRMPGRFDWQGNAVSIKDQTSRAFAREMGLTNAEVTADDCSAAESDCQRAPSGGAPEVSQEFDAILDFQQWLGVPRSPADGLSGPRGAALFRSTGCAACHAPDIPVDLGAGHSGTLHAYTDLLLHDLGDELVDYSVSGLPVASAWRTPPLWGIGFTARAGQPLTLLHDGRARTIAEAVLWHGGEARRARQRFEQLSARQRDALLRWVAER